MFLEIKTCNHPYLSLFRASQDLKSQEFFLKYTGLSFYGFVILKVLHLLHNKWELHQENESETEHLTWQKGQSKSPKSSKYCSYVNAEVAGQEEKRNLEAPPHNNRAACQAEAAPHSAATMLSITEVVPSVL